MAQPTSSDVHVDAALTDMSIAYIQDDGNYVANRVFPNKPVTHKTDKYHIFTKNDWFRDDAVKKRAPHQEAPMSGFNLSTGTYDCDPYWTSIGINELISANADPAVPLDEAATRLLTQRMLIKRDRDFATAFMNTDSVWDTDSTLSGASQWSDSASDPITDVTTGKETVLTNTGLEPNTFVVPYQVHVQLLKHPLITERVKYVGGMATMQLLAQLFDVERYITMKSVYATNVEKGTAAMAFTVGKHALLVHTNGAPDLLTPTAATNFVWTGLTGVNDLGVRIDQYYHDGRKDDIIRGEFAYDMKVTGSDLGYRFKNAVA